MQKIRSRQEAIKQGFPTYFTGNPCIHGHIDERATISGACRQCQNVYQKKATSKIREEFKKKREENKTKKLDGV